MSYAFDNFLVDTDSFELKHGGEPCKVEPLVFDLICHLLSKANLVVSKDELLEVVWQGRIVSDTTIASAVKSARKALGDSGSRQKYIKTVHGRGFSFLLPEDSVEQDRVGKQDLPRFVRPSLLVLVDADEALSAPGDRLASEIERILARVPLLSISSEAARIQKSRDSLSPRQIHELVGCDYLLESRFIGGDKVGLSCQLIDAKAGLLVSSQSYDYGDTETSSLVENATLGVVGHFEPQIVKAIYSSIKSQNLESSAEAMFFEASGLLALKGWHEASFLEAADILRECIRLAPDFSQAHAYLSLLLAFGHRVGILKGKQESRQEAITLAGQALDIDSHDSTVLGYCGCALADVGLTDRGLSLLYKSLTIDPSNSQALVARGAARLMKFELEAAIEDMERGIALSPLDGRLAMWRSFLASAYLVAKQSDKAYAQAMQACIDDHRAYMPRLVLAGTEFIRGNNDECMAALTEAESINPGIGSIELEAILGKSLGSKVYALRH